MPRALGGVLLGLSVVLLTTSCGSGESGGPAPGFFPLVSGTVLCPPIERTVPSQKLEVGHQNGVLSEAGEVDLWRLALTEGSYLGIEATQAEVDLVLCLFDPTQRLLLMADRPTGKEDVEELEALVPGSGTYLLSVRAFSGSDPGAYSLRVELDPTPETALVRRAEAGMATLLADYWRQQGGRAGLERAEGLLVEAAQKRHELGLSKHEADVLYRLGRLRRAVLKDPASALPSLERAASLVKSHGGPVARAQTYGELGQALRGLGRARESLVPLERAQVLYRQLNRSSSFGAMVTELAAARHQLGEYQAALDGYEEAIHHFHSLGEAANQATALHNRGVLYSTLGLDQEAEDDLKAALALMRRAAPSGKVRESTVATLSALGSVELIQGRLPAALKYFEEALPLRRSGGDGIGEAITLGYLGLVKQGLGRNEEALEHHRAAVALVADLPSPCVLARAQVRLSEALADQGDLTAGQQAAEQARAAVSKCSDPFLEARVLFNTAQLRQKRGLLQAALEDVLAAIETTDQLRESPSSFQVRSSFVATKQSYYDLGVDLLMALEASEPGRGHARRALELAERSLSRSLLDLLRQDERAALAPSELLARRQELEEVLLTRREGSPAQSERGPEAREAGLRSLLRERDRVESSIRQGTARDSALSRLVPLSLGQIQKEVLDPETLVLFYRLGDRNSYLWAIGSKEVEVFVLPSRSVLESLARSAHELLSSRDENVAGVRLQLVLQKLSKILLGPATKLLPGKRLVVVADGALQLLAFSALPSSLLDEPTAPLIFTNEVVMAPSLSVVAALEARGRLRPSAKGGLAIYADPVFESTDPRVGASVGTPAQSGRLNGDSAPVRLEASRREASAISALVREEERRVRLDFEASRQNLLADPLEGFRILHFATHSEVDRSYPELSHLVLSLVDEAGQARDGRVYGPEIQRLRLAADLVVLSSCDSGLGKEVQGEGLVGLPYAFFDAGAKRVIVSLWKVSDESTASLMSRFYRYHLVDELSPGAALRQAQIDQWKETPWPYRWAAFVVQGPWR